MKHLFTLLFLAFIATSCEMNGGELDKKNNGLTFAEGTELLAEFKARGGSATFKFTADLDWTVTTSDEHDDDRRQPPLRSSHYPDK